MGVPVHVLSTHIENKAGLQEEARNIRYAFFTETCQANGYYGTFTGHHAQDQAETILHNLFSGTGLNGMGGMKVWNESRRVGRPLLACPKNEITAYAFAHNLTWREDSSNSSAQYSRNRTRHALLPILQMLEPNWQANLLKTAAQATEAWQELANPPLNVEQWPAKVDMLAFDNRFSRASYLQSAYPGLTYPHALRLAEASMAPNHPDRRLQTAWGMFEAKDQAVYFAPAWVESSGSKKEIPPPPPSISWGPAKAPATLEVLKEEALKGRYYITQAPDAGCQMPNCDQRTPGCEAPAYTLRAPEVGDRMQPLGMQGTKLLSDLRTEKGLPASWMRDVRVLVRNGVILWCSLGIVAEPARCTLGAPALCITIS
jgi:tRNA(Ile)-lysidine synthetase-like protein